MRRACADDRGVTLPRPARRGRRPRQDSAGCVAGATSRTNVVAGIVERRNADVVGHDGTTRPGIDDLALRVRAGRNLADPLDRRVVHAVVPVARDAGIAGDGAAPAVVVPLRDEDAAPTARRDVDAMRQAACRAARVAGRGRSMHEGPRTNRQSTGCPGRPFEPRPPPSGKRGWHRGSAASWAAACHGPTSRLTVVWYSTSDFIGS